MNALETIKQGIVTGNISKVSEGYEMMTGEKVTSLSNDGVQTIRRIQTIINTFLKDQTQPSALDNGNNIPDPILIETEADIEREASQLTMKTKNVFGKEHITISDTTEQEAKESKKMSDRILKYRQDNNVKKIPPPEPAKPQTYRCFKCEKDFESTEILPKDAAVCPSCLKQGIKRL